MAHKAGGKTEFYRVKSRPGIVRRLFVAVQTIAQIENSVGADRPDVIQSDVFGDALVVASSQNVVQAEGIAGELGQMVPMDGHKAALVVAPVLVGSYQK